MRKPKEIKKRHFDLLETPGLKLSPENREKYLAPPQQAECKQAEREIEELKREKAECVTRCGEKLRRLREHMTADKRGDEFARFRFCSERYASQGYHVDDYQQEGYPPGGVYAQDEDDREAFIDAKLKAEGLTDG